MGTFLRLCLQTVCLVQKNVSAFHRELNHCDQREVLWVFTMKCLPVCGLVFQRLLFKSNWNVLALMHYNPNVSGSPWLLQSLQYFLCLIVLVKCFTFWAQLCSMSFSVGKALHCLGWNIQGAQGLVGFFFYFRAFHLGEEYLGRKTNQTGKIWGCLKPKLCSLLVVESDGWIWHSAQS